MIRVWVYWALCGVVGFFLPSYVALVFVFLGAMIIENK